MPTNFPTLLDDYENPTAADKLSGSPNPATIHHVQHSNHNDAVEALEAKVGINFSSVTTSLDFIINLLLLTQTEHPAGGFREITPLGAPFPTSIIWYTDSGKTIKLVEKNYTYDPQHRITVVVLKLYDGTLANVLKRTLTDTKTFQGPFEKTRSRVVS